MNTDRPSSIGPVSAPGKSFLIGEYAVLEGHEAVITAVDVRAYAHTPRTQHGERPDPSSPFVAAAEAFLALRCACCGRGVERSGVQDGDTYYCPTCWMGVGRGGSAAR